MAQGDKLHSLLHPESLEVQVRKLKRKLAQAQAHRSSGVSWLGGMGGEGVGGGSGGNGPSRNVPTPNTDDITATVSLEKLKDGTVRPAVAVTVDPSYEAVRGFMGYYVRLTAPDGERRTITVGTQETATGIVAEALTIRDLALPDAALSTADWQVEIAVRSSIFGQGAWSEPKTVSLSDDTDPPAASVSAPTLAARFGTLDVTWTEPTEADYALTEVYKGVGDFVLGAGVRAAAVKGGRAAIAWDAVADATTAGYTSIKVRHGDTSGNWSALSPAATVTGGLTSATKLVGGNMASAITYSGALSLGPGGSVVGGGITLTASGMVAAGSTAFQVVDDDGVFLGGLYGTGHAIGSTQAVVVSSNKKLTVLATNEIQLTSPERVYLFSNPVGSGQIRLNASSLLFDGPITASGHMTIPTQAVGSTNAMTGDAPLEVQGSNAGLVLEDRAGGSSERWLVYSQRGLGAGSQTLRWKTNGADRMTLSSSGGMTLVSAVLSGAFTAASATINGVLSAASLLINGTKLTVGSSFPGSPSSGDTHYRSDLNVWCRYDGTRWLGPEQPIPMHNYLGTPPFSANQEALAGSLRSDRAWYITRYAVSYYTGGGVDGSNYWRVYLRRLSSGISVDNLGYLQTTSNNWHKLSDLTTFSNNPLNASDIWLQVYLEKTGGPNPIYVQVAVYGRVVYT